MTNIFSRIFNNRVFPLACVAFSVCALAVGAYTNNGKPTERVAETVLEEIEETILVEQSDEEVKAFDWAAVRTADARDHVADYVNRSFRVPMAEARQIVEWAVALGEARDLDPLLILAVIGTESSYNPAARSGAGAEGLMQVMTRVHVDKFQSLGGAEKALDPYANMVVGTEILQYLIRKTGGVREGLKWYCGAARLKTDGGYATRVFRELSRLQVAALGQVDNAVILSYRKKSGPSVESGQRGEHLGFSRWVKNNEKIRGQAAHAGGGAKKATGSPKEVPAV